MSRPKRYALAIELTSFCNQKCSYCYNGWREDGGKSIGSLPTETLLSLVDRALTEVEFDHVTLTGGEPFARNDFFDVIGLCEKHGVRAQIISNGGVVTDAIAERLAPFKPYFVQVTLNGHTKELHEEHVGDGHDHYDKTLVGIENMQRHGVNVVGCIVITRKNAAHVGTILDQFYEMGIKNIALSRFSPAGFATAHTADLLCSRSELLHALELAEARGRDKGMSLQVTMPVPPCVVDHADFPHVRFGGCPIGTEMQEFALGPSGELRNCTLHEESLGNAKDESSATLVESDKVMHYRDVTPEFCAPCPHKSSCLGGCGAAAGWVLGNPRGLDPFVAQHVDDALSDRLAETRRRGGDFVPMERLIP
ncbi:MAG: radical SAM protein [Myxococcota bacterium]